jgi:hypothetical protein
MNAATLVMVPLRATVVSTRWITVLALSLMLVVCVALQWTQSLPKTALIAPVISGYGEFFVGLLFVAPFLLMAIDTRELRIPRSQSTIVLGMLLYSALWIAVPSIALALAGADFVTVLTIQTVGLLFGLTFGLLPRVFLIVAGFSPSFLGLVHIRLHYPGKPTVLLLWLAAVVLALVSALCWRRQVRSTDPYGEGFNKPLVLRSRSGNRTGFMNWNDWATMSGNSRQIRSQPQWMLAIANLRGTGPQNPVLSLRVGLGGWTLPKTWQSASRQWLLVLAPIMLTMGLVYLRSPELSPAFFHAIVFSAVVWVVGFGSMVLSLTTIVLLQQRWSRSNAELPVLALLPGLGDGGETKKYLLRASLLPTLLWQAVLVALLVATSFVKQASALEVAIAALAEIVAVAFTPAFAFAIFGGQPPAQWIAGLVAGVSFALIGCGTAASSILEISRTYGAIMVISIITIWLAILAFLIGLGVRGWRGLQARPHPFLAN